MAPFFRIATDADAARIVRFWHDSGASMTLLDSVEHVRRLIAHPTARLLPRRRDGIATQLVAQIESFFAQHGARRITVLVEADRHWAAEFWTAIGYPLDTHVVRHLGQLP